MASRDEPRGKISLVLSRELLHKEISTRLSRLLGLALTVQLALGLLLSLGIIALFAKIVEDVVEGESRRFDKTVLLWIHWYSPGWLDGVMRFVTVLGDYWVVIPLLAVAAYAFYRKGRTISAGLLVVSTIGGIVLTSVLKNVFERARPDLFESAYVESSYSFPSAHATMAVGFYGTLTLLLAWRSRGLRRWVVVLGGLGLVLVIGFSRMYLGVHYPTDVVAGFLAAPLWISTIGLCYFLYLNLRRVRLTRRLGRHRTSTEEDGE
ncbi:MAG: phosphatase PAP2 family protein [Actinobacteria bacterium]|nr:phosphatase PAP2 family protein [Actinomycetota bacterium]